MPWDQAFDLAVMASNVFQVLVTDQDLQASLAATRAALAEGGRLVFGTRNPRVRAEGWNPANPIDVVDHADRALRISYRVESVTGDVVTFTETGDDIVTVARVASSSASAPGLTAARVVVPRHWSDGGGQFCGCVGGPGVPRLPGAAPAA